MIKKRFTFSFILAIFLLFTSACSVSSNDIITISAHTDSDYATTFKDLNLGILYDFEIKLPQADKRWVNLWVERYNDGQKETHPVAQLSYGHSPNEVEQGALGFGLINPDSKDPLALLYGPGVSSKSVIRKKESEADVFRSWNYGIGEEAVELVVGETTLLAFYRENKGDSMSSVNLQDEEAVNKMIKQDDLVYLLKIKIEEISERAN